MLCEVYPLRENGCRLTAEAIRGLRVVGWLALADRTPGGAPETCATVCDANGVELLPALRPARVQRIDRGGVLMVGFLDLGRSAVPERQAWWWAGRACGASPD